MNPNRLGGGNDYTTLPAVPTETIAIAGSQHDGLSAVEAGGVDSDD